MSENRSHESWLRQGIRLGRLASGLAGEAFLRECPERMGDSTACAGLSAAEIDRALWLLQQELDIALWDRDSSESAKVACIRAIPSFLSHCVANVRGPLDGLYYFWDGLLSPGPVPPGELREAIVSALDEQLADRNPYCQQSARRGFDVLR